MYIFLQKSAIKYSGLKPLAYNNTKKVVENLLEVSGDKLTISMLCVTLQCTGVQDLADKILEEYQRQAKMVSKHLCDSSKAHLYIT